MPVYGPFVISLLFLSCEKCQVTARPGLLHAKASTLVRSLDCNGKFLKKKQTFFFKHLGMLLIQTAFDQNEVECHPLDVVFFIPMYTVTRPQTAIAPSLGFSLPEGGAPVIWTFATGAVQFRSHNLEGRDARCSSILMQWATAPAIVTVLEIKANPRCHVRKHRAVYLMIAAQLPDSPPISKGWFCKLAVKVCSCSNRGTGMELFK